MRSLAEVQIQADLKRLHGKPVLLRRKWARMTTSPFAFLRGASALWAEALRRDPALLRDLPGAGVLTGDLHLENFGTFRTTRGDVAFHVNDLDETFQGSWAFDLARLATSTLLARPELQVTGLDVVEFTHELLDGHARAIAGVKPVLPPSLSSLIENAERKRDDKLLARRLTSESRLERGERTPAAPRSLFRPVEDAVGTWAQETGQKKKPHLIDLTRRVAGTGSLGVERLVALIDLGDDARLLEIKEVRGSPYDPSRPDARRLVENWRRCLPKPPAEIVAAKLGRMPVVVRPLFACDEKLDEHSLDRTTLPRILNALGQLTGELHLRGASSRVKWAATHRRKLLDAATTLAGVHEEAFVHFCRDVAEMAH